MLGVRGKSSNWREKEMPDPTSDDASSDDPATLSEPPSSVPSWYWLAYLTGGFGLAFNAMMTFLLPLRAHDLGINIVVIGVLLGVKGAVEALVSVPVGGVVDRIGPRRVFIISTIISTIVIVMYGMATSVVALILLQIVVGVARPMAWLGSQSFVSGLRKGAHQAKDTGRLSMVATGSQIVAPLLVGFAAQTWDTGGAVYAFAAYCSLYVVVGFLIPKGADAGSRQAKKRQGLVAGLRLLAIRNIQVVMFLTFARVWITTAFVAFFPLLLVTGGYSEGTAATVVAVSAVVATLVSPTSGRLAERLQVHTIAAVALTFGAVGLVLAPTLDSIPAAYAVAILVGIGNGLSLPTLLVLVSRAVSADRRGLALGLRASVNQVAAALAPILVAAVIGATAATVGFVLAAGVAAAFIGSATATSHKP
jgi:predicted MFS family arabinose efflux permease